MVGLVEPHAVGEQYGNHTFSETLVNLFMHQVQSVPDRLAVQDTESSLTYRELDTRSTQLAQRLRRYGVGRETIVPVFLTPGVDIVVAIWSVLKAGAAYAPIDIYMPEERLIYILKDTACQLIVTQQRYEQKIPAREQYELLFVDQSPVETMTVNEALELPLPQDLAYIIYTSGSTGLPKGVMIEHSQIYTYTLDVYAQLRLSKCNSFAILGTFSADAGLSAFFSALCFGKSLHILDVKNISGFPVLRNYFRHYPVDCYKTTPSLMRFFLEHESAWEVFPLKRLLLGGEATSRELAHRVFALLPSDCVLFNHYGPTETTVGVITYEFPVTAADFPSIIPLGMVLPHVTAHVLDEQFQPVPPGHTGELYIEGPLLGRGYLNSPALSSAKFITSFLAGDIRRLYKTGDLVRQGSHGHLEFLGRRDGQVKINGHRVEVQEVEYLIGLTGMIGQCVVLATENSDGSICLTGYLIVEAGFEFRKFTVLLRERLPVHMIPSKWILLDAWPLTLNNKIDQQALKAMKTANLTKPSVPDILTERETFLQNLWKTLLGDVNFSATDHFFSLGGDSLRLMKLCYQLSTELNFPVAANDLLGHLTLQDMARYLDDYQPPDVISGNDLVGEEVVSAAQKNLFFKNKLRPSAFPNATLSFKIAGRLSITRLQQALHLVIATHESLRTTYQLHAGKVVKQIHPGFQLPLTQIHARQAIVDQEIITLTQPFDFSAGPLIRVFLIEMTEADQYFHIDMPHINADGESLKVVLSDLELAYNNGYLPEGRPQYRDFQNALFSYCRSDTYKRDQSFWSRQLEREFPVLSFPFTLHASKGRTIGAAYCVKAFPQELAVRLGEYVQQRRTTSFRVLLTAYFLLLFRICQTSKIAVMVPVHNRHQPGMDQIVGLLSNVILFCADVSDTVLVGAFIKACEEAIVEALRHQRFPFEHLVDLYQAKGGNGRLLAQSFFGYHLQKDIYKLGEGELHLYIPEKDEENLPLSLSVFQMKSGVVLRISSAPGGFSPLQLANWLQVYTELVSRLIDAEPNQDLKDILTGASFLQEYPRS